MPRSSWKLVASLSALVALVIGVVGIQAQRDLALREARIQRVDLEARTDLARMELGDLALENAPAAELGRRARAIAETSGTRVTLVARDGRVVADSAVPPARLSQLENHGQRAEVVAALREGRGYAVRRSASVGRDLRYAALPVAAGDGVIRLALESPEQARVTFFGLLGGWLGQALVVGLLGALILGIFIARSAAQSIERMQTVATSLAGGDFSQRVRRHSGDELDPLAGAIDQLAEQLRLRLDEATQEKERLRAILNGMVEGVVVVDTGGKLVLVNDRAREFFALEGDVDGRSYLEVLRNAALDDLLRDAAGTDEEVAAQIELGPAGDRVLRAQAVRFPAGAGARMGTVAVFHDVTEIVRLEQVRRDFVANASHELRTPLTAISGFTEMLLSSQSLDDASRRSYLEVIDRHAQRLIHLVTDLLELSTVEGRRVSLAMAEVDVGALAERLLEDYYERAQAKDILASVECRGRPIARADERALEQVFINLIDNALKYTAEGGSLVVRVEQDDERVRVSVIDDGIGIPAAARERIFERFYRVDKARSREAGGTGLGLSIVKNLVQSLGGEIAVESTLGEGSTFRFTLARADVGDDGGAGSAVPTT